MEDVSKQKDVVAFAEGLEGVRKVNKSDVVAKTLTSVNKLVGYVSVAIIAILLAVSIFLISNTVTMGITCLLYTSGAVACSGSDSLRRESISRKT